MPKKNTLSLNLNDIEIDISLDKIIEREVKKRVEEEKQKLKEEYEKQLPVINIGGRRQGNTYRLLLYAQLLASGRPDQNVIIVTHTDNYARQLLTTMADMANVSFYGCLNRATRVFEFPNKSRVHFISENNLRYCERGLRNMVLLFDNSCYD